MNPTRSKGSTEIMFLKYTSGDENHLCGASLCKSHKISLKVHRHACAHGFGTPIATPEKLYTTTVKVSQIASSIVAIVQ